MSSIIDVRKAKGQLTDRICRAASGEDIIIAVDGEAKAKLVSLPNAGEPRVPAHAMQLTYIADDFDAPDPTIGAGFECGD